MKEYQIETIADIVTKIPADKFDRFCREMVEGLKQTKELFDLVNTMGEIMGTSEPATLPRGFTWVDDDKDTATITVKMSDPTDTVGVEFKMPMPEAK